MRAAVSGFAPGRRLYEVPLYFSTFGANYTKVLSLIETISASADSTNQTEGFDPGSERTLAAWLRHASRTDHAIE